MRILLAAMPLLRLSLCPLLLLLLFAAPAAASALAAFDAAWEGYASDEYVALLQEARMTADDVQRVLSAGWSEQALEDAINVAAVFSYVNRLVDAFGFEGDEPYFEQIGAALARYGYAPLLRSRPAKEVV